ncbi:MAG: CCA tRNA nucleotidyltransferase [Hyphomonadaceae bacterium]
MTSLPADTGWLNTDEARCVMAALDAARPSGARFVGGCVRNTLMGRPVDDIDIATQLTPENTIKALELANIRAIPTGLEHGTVTAIVNHIPFEITSLRRDVETDGRRAVVAFTEDWDEDAQRRDFRLNAIYADADGKLYDPTGGGLDDAAAGRVIFIGDADQRLREDYLRILRFFRFNAWYARKVDEDGLAACARQKEGLKQIAAERIWKELKKLLSASWVHPSVTDMQRAGILDIILPHWLHAGLPMDTDVTAGSYVEDIEDSETAYDLPIDPLRRLMGLLPIEEPAMTATADALRLSNQERDRLLVQVKLAGYYESAADVRRDQYLFGREAMLDWVAQITDYNVWEILKANPDVPVFPLKGEDLLKAGLEAGPAIGDLLRELEAWWIEGDFAAGKAELLEELERRLKAD